MCLFGNNLNSHLFSVEFSVVSFPLTEFIIFMYIVKPILIQLDNFNWFHLFFKLYYICLFKALKDTLTLDTFIRQVHVTNQTKFIFYISFASSK